MKEKRAESLSVQIETTRQKVADWPEWMRSIAYFSGTDASHVSVKSGNSSTLKKATPKRQAA